MAKYIHTMIRVMDEQRSVDFYNKVFGMEVTHRLDFPDFTLTYLVNKESGFEIELTINKDREEPYDLGDGYGHVAFIVDDLEAEHQRFTGLGVEPRKIVEFKNEDELLAKFFFLQDPDGYKIEILQKYGHYV
ncbi:MAG: VOC family protein [Deltaproteobacteria bacterium]|jgi:lactoylglutathione lyase